MEQHSVKRLLIAVLALLALLLQILTIAFFTGWSAMGAQPEGARLQRIQTSTQWRDGQFVNGLPQVEPDPVEAMQAWFGGGSPHNFPAETPRYVQRSAQKFVSPPATGLRITWLGHSTLLIEIGGLRILVDPVWGERSSPFNWVGPRRFLPPPLALEALPEIDAVLISHDHYDHLDFPTIRQLIETDIPFLVPLGIGSHLEHWGVPAVRIIERDWWQEHHIGDVRLVATPARHFSGRSILLQDRNATLWCGWAILGPGHKVYYSGDTAMFPGFTEIGERLGPFDATMIESGAYNALWADVHLGPEQAVQAHIMVGGGVMIPVHWGLFDLSLHSWTEPIERVLAAARDHGVSVVTPRPGASLEPTAPMPPERWWPQTPWQTAQQAPVVSSHLEGLKLP
jgi:L-ascorbate metabolism protein UlaG (beta-lactamase superfamily)